jgi:DNA-binding NarL/FixJ family response regulator
MPKLTPDASTKSDYRNEKIRVLIVDDDPLVLAGLKAILDTDDRIQVIGRASNGLEALELSKSTHPNVLLMDIRMPVMDGIEATMAIRQLVPAPQVVVLTTFSLDDYVLQAIHAGAGGFLLKDSHPKDIIESVFVVHRGEGLIAPAVTRGLLDHVAKQQERSGDRDDALKRISALTPTERTVLVRILGGLSNLQIANELFMSESAVKAHINRMYPKLGVPTRVQAAVLAHTAGLA